MGRLMLVVVLALSVSGCDDGDGDSDGDVDADGDVAEDGDLDGESDADSERSLPDLTCRQGFVDQDLGEPAVIEPCLDGSGETRRPARALRLPGRSVGPSGLDDVVDLQLDLHESSTTALAHGGVGLGGLLAARGLRSVAIGRGWWLVQLRDVTDLAAVSDLEQLDGLFRIGADDKLHPSLRHRSDEAIVDVIVHRTAGEGEVQRERLTGLSMDRVRQLAHGVDVVGIEERFPRLPLVDRGRQTVHTDEVQQVDMSSTPPTYDGLTGRGVVVGVVDTGMDADHPDFLAPDGAGPSRVVGDGPHDGTDAHGTGVGSIVAGAGHASEDGTCQNRVGEPFQWRGHAPGVEQIISVHMGTEEAWIPIFIDHDAFVSNHSYIQGNGWYSSDAADWDRVVHEGPRDAYLTRPRRVVVFAAANSGLGSPFTDRGIFARGYYSILAPGKNPICVGGSNGNDGSWNESASIGPTMDGRLRPDVIAPGYMDYRPHDGIDFEIDEIRLVAAVGSGAEDLVWDFDDATLQGWTVSPEGSEAAPAGGTVSGNSIGALQLYRDLTEGAVAAAEYSTVQVRIRLDAGPAEGPQRWPWFWVFAWDNTGEGGLSDFRYPRITDDVRGDPDWHTLEVDLSSVEAWEGDVSRLMVWPVVYDDRVAYAVPGGGYAGGNGTSMAAPVVTGIVALMMERLAAVQGMDLRNEPLWPSTFKVLLIQTARDIVQETPNVRDRDNPDTGAPAPSFVGPDWGSGYGLVNAERAVGLIDSHGEGRRRWTEQHIDSGVQHIYTVPVRGDLGGALRVTIAWDDPPGEPALPLVESRLVNDLDLVVVDPEGVAHSPWILTLPPMADTTLSDGLDPIAPDDVVPPERCAVADFWTEETLSCEDHANNVEQVLIDVPVEGWYEVRVRAHDVPVAPQAYSLVLTQECDVD